MINILIIDIVDIEREKEKLIFKFNNKHLKLKTKIDVKFYENWSNKLILAGQWGRGFVSPGLSHP